MSIPARTPSSRLVRAAFAAVAALALAACSGTSDSVETGSPVDDSGSLPVPLTGQVANHGEEQITGSAPELELELDDSYFAPTFVRTEPGAVVKVELVNEGTKVHTFTIDDRTVDVSVEPGATATVDVTVPDSGRLHFFCQIHSGAGMQGSFIADGGSAPATSVPASPSTTSAPTTSDSYRPY
jgi:plastocyanin